MAPFDESLVPAGPARDYFYSGRTGEPTTDAEWDEQKRRLLDAGAPLPWAPETFDQKEATDG